MLGEEEDWYKLTVPADRNTVQITLSGTPTVRTVIHVEDSTGSQVRLTQSLAPNSILEVSKPWSNQERSYWIKVEEPPRAVVFAFDNSGSVHRLCDGNLPGHERLRGRPRPRPRRRQYLALWWRAPHQRTGLGNRTFNKSSSTTIRVMIVSSAAEESLDKAARALSNETGHQGRCHGDRCGHPALPRDVGQPRGGAATGLHHASGQCQDTSGLYEDLMQSWAMVNDGALRLHVDPRGDG